jgi:hypothetical protein
MTRSLRAVPEGAKAEKPERLTVAAAAATGDHRKLLVSMRERIAQTVSNPDCPPRDLAALTRRLQDIAKEIEALDRRAEQEGREGVSSPDEDFDASAL